MSFVCPEIQYAAVIQYAECGLDLNIGGSACDFSYVSENHFCFLIMTCLNGQKMEISIHYCFRLSDNANKNIKKIGEDLYYFINKYYSNYWIVDVFI